MIVQENYKLDYYKLKQATKYNINHIDIKFIRTLCNRNGYN